AAVDYYGLDLMYGLNNMSIPRERVLALAGGGSPAVLGDPSHRYGMYVGQGAAGDLTAAAALRGAGDGLSLDSGHLTGTLRFDEDGLLELVDGRITFAQDRDERVGRTVS